MATVDRGIGNSLFGLAARVGRSRDSRAWQPEPQPERVLVAASGGSVPTANGQLKFR